MLGIELVLATFKANILPIVLSLSCSNRGQFLTYVRSVIAIRIMTTVLVIQSLNIRFYARC